MGRGVVKTVVATAVCAVLAGCETIPELVDEKNDLGHTTLELDYRDFQKAADEAIEGLIASGNVDRPGGGRYVIMVSTVKNDTAVDVDPDMLTKKIRVALMNSRKVVVSTAVGMKGPEDASTALVQSEFGGGGIVKPELSLFGKIISRKPLHYESSKSQFEYYLQLTLTNLAGGYSVWEGETRVIKRGSSKTVAW